MKIAPQSASIQSMTQLCQLPSTISVAVDAGWGVVFIDDRCGAPIWWNLLRAWMLSDRSRYDVTV